MKMILHDCNRKQLHSLKPREWVDREVEVVGKGNLPDKLYCYFLVENEYGGDLNSCEKNMAFTKALQHRLKDKHDCGLFMMKFLENASDLKSIKKLKVDSTDRPSYVFKLFMSDDNMARGTVLCDLGYVIECCDKFNKDFLELNWDAFLPRPHNDTWTGSMNIAWA
ncbi:hypothetical protein M9H77_03524 [Catharanthus roseus]|uniref:Uncharacterized protein n=1 Tax=Catharanthus roseus TaxID=4058 RepID=A0ACC0CBI2_CATRO|nr:hypothetical protein M9H77_03524 [Catharanthus roseus]